MRTLLYTNPTSSSSSSHFAAAATPGQQPLAVDSDVVVILAALLCALICVIGLALVARCACLRRSINSNNSSKPSNKGLNKKAIKALPKVAFSQSTTDTKNNNNNNNNNNDDDDNVSDCAICLERFKEGEEVRVLPECGHVFHVGCVDAWLGSRSSCPSCRRVLVVGPKTCHKCGARADAGEVAAKAREDGSFLP